MKVKLWIVAGLVCVLVGACGRAESSPDKTANEAKPASKPSSHRGPRWSGAPLSNCYDGQRRVRRLVLTLAGRGGPESAGLILAYERGYFADVGLNMSILAPQTPIRPITYVIWGYDDLGVASQPQVALAIRQGAPIVAVGSLVDRPTAAMIWLKRSKISGIADLKGKTIAIPGLSFQMKLLEVILGRAGLTLEDVTVNRVGYDLIPTLLSGEADAIFGGSWNVEGQELKTRGADPVVTRIKALGVPPYEEMVVFARVDCAVARPGALRRFVAALRRGTAATLEDPLRAARGVATNPERNPELSRRDLEAGTKATLPILSRSARMDPRRAAAFFKWMHQHGLIRRQLPVSELLTNEYLPRP